MTDEEHFSAALEAVYDHDAKTRHGLRFLLSLSRLEVLCRLCRAVLYLGPTFLDASGMGYEAWTAPRRRAQAH